MAEQFESIYWRGQGPGFLGLRDSNGNPLGLSFAGDIESIEGTPNIQAYKVKENVTSNRNVAARWPTGSEYPISIVFKSTKPTHLANALSASVTALTAGSATSEPHVAYQDKMLKLDHIKVSAFSLTGTGGTPTYNAGSDFILHADEGMVEILSTGSIADAADVEANYSYAAQTQVKGDPQTKEYVLVFPGINTANGNKRGRCTIHRLSVDPGFLGLLQPEQEANITVQAEMLLDTSRPAGDQLYSWDYED